MSSHPIEITDRARHQQISVTALLHEQSRDALPIANRILRRRRFMIDVTRIHVCAGIEQHDGNVRAGCDVQWCLAITAAGVNERRIAGEKTLESVDAPEPRRGMNIQARPAVD
jgi:hypothetical protein